MWLDAVLGLAGDNVCYLELCGEHILIKSLTACDPTRTFDGFPTNLVRLSSYGSGHGAGFLLVGMRAAPLSLPASPCAGLASIPNAILFDASEAIKGLHLCTTVPQSFFLFLRKNRCV